MNPVTAYPMAHALGWTLLHFCWQGTAVALLLWCVLGAVRSSSRLRYAASCVALGLLVVLPLMTFARLVIEDYRLAALASAPIQAADIFVSAVAGGAGSPWTARLSAELDRAMPVVLAAWFAGVFCLLGRLSLGLFAAHRLRADGASVSGDLQELFERLCERIGITRIVRLLNSAHVEVPTVVGWLRPVVLLPASCLTGLAPEQIEAILCHELAHVRRHDYLISVLQSLVETLLFYHPAVWWVSRQIRRERECCCDEVAVSSGGDVLAYARALSFLEEQRSLAPQLVLGANGGVLKMRIQRLLGRPESSATSQIASIAVLVLLAASMLGIAGRIAWAETRGSEIGHTSAPSQTHAQSSDPLVTASASSTDQVTSPERSVAVLDPQAATLPQAADHSTVSEMPGDDASPELLRAQFDGAITQLERQEAAYAALLVRQHEEKQLGKDDLRRLQDARRAMAQSQRQYNEALARWLKARQQSAQAAMAKVNTPEFQRQIADVQAAITRLNSEDLRHEMEQAAAGSAQVNSLELRKKLEDATKAAQKVRQIAGQGLLALNATPAATEVPSPDRQPMQPNPSSAQRVSSGVMQSLIVSRPQPVYPAIAKAAHVQGVVVLHAIISKEGMVEKLVVVSGPPMLVQSAVDAVQKWTYQPFLVNGQPVEVETTINVNYTFGGPDLSCTYYDRGVPQAGTCEEDKTNKGNYSCRANDDSTLVQSQSSCEWKIKRLQESQHSDLSTAVIHPPAPVVTPGRYIASNGGSATDRGGNVIRKIGGNVTAPQVIHQVEPEFTDEAKAHAKAEGKDGKFQGAVLVQLIVNTSGQPENVHVVRGAGMGLDEKAVGAVSQYRFRPAMENGKPVPVLLNVEVNFKSF